MKRVLFYLLILIASVWLGLIVADSPGYVLVTYQQLAIETTLWFALLAMVVTFVISYLLVRVLSYVLHAQDRFRLWRQARVRRRARLLMQQGLRELAEGDFDRAEKLLLKSAQDSENPLMNYLMAANAAQGQNNAAARDTYLQRALLVADDAQIAVGITQAQLQLDTNQLEQSVMTLERLHEMEPKNKHILNLLQAVYLKLEDWDGLKQVMPQLKRYKVLADDALQALERTAYLAHFKLITPRYSADELRAAWKKLPSHMRCDAATVICYSDGLETNGEHAEAEKIVRKALATNWDPMLVRHYGRVKSPKPAQQLALAESWLEKHPQDPDFLMCLGQLCLQNKLWGKARSAFESSVSLKPSVATLRDLGRVYEELDDTALALNCYRDAVDICLKV